MIAKFTPVHMRTLAHHILVESFVEGKTAEVWEIVLLCHCLNVYSENFVEIIGCFTVRVKL